MLPVLAMPLHDPDGLMSTHLVKVTPQLKAICARV